MVLRGTRGWAEMGDVLGARASCSPRGCTRLEISSRRTILGARGTHKWVPGSPRWCAWHAIASSRWAAPVNRPVVAGAGAPVRAGCSRSQGMSRAPRPCLALPGRCSRSQGVAGETRAGRVLPVNVPRMLRLGAWNVCQYFALHATIGRRMWRIQHDGRYRAVRMAPPWLHSALRRWGDSPIHYLSLGGLAARLAHPGVG